MANDSQTSGTVAPEELCQTHSVTRKDVRWGVRAYRCGNSITNVSKITALWRRMFGRSSDTVEENMLGDVTRHDPWECHGAISEDYARSPLSSPPELMDLR
ncbi:hypothetical protein Tco_0489498 [Tanacetum coccineum]